MGIKAVSEALDAITYGKATQYDYDLCKRSGIGFVNDYIWYKEFEVNTQQAYELLNEARERGIIEGPNPASEADAISEAEGLVMLAKQAWDQNVRGPEVEAVLRIAFPEFDGNGHFGLERPEEFDSGGQQMIEEPPEIQKVDLGQPQEITGEEEERILTTPGVPEAIEEAAKAFEEPDYSKPPFEGYDDLGDKERRDRIDKILLNSSDEDAVTLLHYIRDYELLSKAPRKRVIKMVEELLESATKTKAAMEELDEATTRSKEDSPREKETLRSEASEPVEEQREEADAGTDSERKADQPPEEDRREDAVEEKSKYLITGSNDVRLYNTANTSTTTAAFGTVTYQIGTSGGEPPKAALEGNLEEEFKKDRAHIPSPYEGEPVETHYDLTAVSDKELQRLHSFFSAQAYRTAYLLSLSDMKAHAARDEANALFQELLAKADRYDKNGKAKTITVLEAELDQLPELKELRKRQRRHEIHSNSYRQERDSYQKMAEAISRQASMRHESWEHERR